MNSASASYSIVAGGISSHAAAGYSMAAGRRAKANHIGSFVWGDSVNADKASSTNDEFNVYASGGARFFSNSSATTGVILAPGGGSWTAVSDQNAKENFASVDGRDVLERLMEIPISTWNYKSQDDGIRHMGPMAQDFWAAFELGLGDKSIATIDPDGVALAAIQGMYALFVERIAELEERLAKAEARLASE